MRDTVPQVSDQDVPAGRLADQLCFALYSATNAVTRVYRPLLQEIGLDPKSRIKPK